MPPRTLLLPAVLLVTLAASARVAAAQSPTTTEAAPRADIADALPEGAVGRLGNRRLRHVQSIRGVGFLRGPDLVTSVGLDGRMCIWTADTGRQVNDLRVVEPAMTSFAASHDGTLIVVGAREGAARRVTLPSGHVEPVPVPGDHFAVSGDGAWIVGWTENAGGLALGAADGTGEPRSFDARVDRLDGAALSATGDRLAAAGRRILSRQDVRAVVSIWSTEDGELLAHWELPASAGTTLALLPADGNPRVALGLADGRLVLLEAGTEEPVLDLPAHTTTVTALSQAPDGALLTGSYAGELARWDEETLARPTPEASWRIAAHRGPLWAIAASSDGSRLVTGGDDQVVRLWRVDGTPALSFDRHESGLRALARSPDDTLIATADWAGRIAVWPRAGGAPRWLQGHVDAVNTLAFLQDDRLVSTGRDGSLRLWDTASGAEVGAMALEAAVLDSAVSPDGQTLATARGDGRVDLWSVPSGDDDSSDPGGGLTWRGSVDSGGGMAFAVAFAPDGRHLATGSSLVRLFSIDGGEPVWEHVVRSPVADLAFAADGSRLAVAAADRSVHLLDAATGDEQARLRGHDGRVAAVAFSPDGATLASAGTGAGAVLLWDVATGERRPDLAGHAAPVTALEWSDAPDGGTLVSASSDSTALIWRVEA